MSKLNCERFGVITRGRYAGHLYDTRADERVPADEPVFILRASDAASIDALRAYVASDWTRVRGLRGRLRAVLAEWRRWRRANRTRIQEPV